MSTVSPAARVRKSRIEERAFPQTLAWRMPLPADLNPAVAWDEKSDNWRRWRQHLLERPSPLAALTEAAGKTWPLAWGGNDSSSSELLKLLRPMTVAKRRRQALSQSAEFLRPWLAEAAGLAADETFARECLAWCHALPELASVLPSDQWWELLEFAIAAARESANEAAPELQPGNPLPQLLLAGELPLCLASLFPEIDECARLGPMGQRAAIAAAIRLLDGEGLPHARNMPLLRPLLACWTRCRLLLAWQPSPAPVEEDPAQWAHFVRHAVRWSRTDGSSLFAANSGDDRQLLAVALKTADDPLTQRLAELALSPAGGHKPPRAKLLAKKHSPKKRLEIPQPSLPEAGYESDWSEASLLRSDWRRQTNALAVTFHDGAVNLELLVRGEPFLAGPWGFEAAFHGEPLSLLSSWECVCWFSDADVDFLELQTRCSQGVKVQRQLLLARKDRFLLLADCLLPPAAGKLAYRGTLPLGAELTTDFADETREGYLQRGRKRLLAVPLALPEWRRDPRGGSLTADSTGLHLQQSAERQALYCPLFIDLDSQRNKGQLTWRQLTVAQDRRNVAADVAVGYRVQVAKEQFVIYRSLGPAANRTLLGSNLVTECMVGRFTPTGEVQTILEIE